MSQRHCAVLQEFNRLFKTLLRILGKRAKNTLLESHNGTMVPGMRIIALSSLKAFWEKAPEYQDAQEPTLAWHRYAAHADWGSPAGVKRDFRNASILKDGRGVFNIAGNKR
ncbi:hypothetical protein MELB17_14828 [Marinobacter sp. ELB17]|nr:hypothetical protein MELB17_14828 [Marinobacter sp. ELB17]